MDGFIFGNESKLSERAVMIRKEFLFRRRYAPGTGLIYLATVILLALVLR